MEVCRRSSWLLLLLGVSLLATTLQGVQGEVESEGPSESECRPYIEKALKELETGESGTIGTPETGDSKEDAPTVEVTTDDSDHQEGEGDDDTHEEGTESIESVEADQNVPDEQQSDQEETQEESAEGTETEHDAEDPDTQEETGASQEQEGISSDEGQEQKAEEADEEVDTGEDTTEVEGEEQTEQENETTEEGESLEEKTGDAEGEAQDTEEEEEATQEEADTKEEETDTKEDTESIELEAQVSEEEEAGESTPEETDETKEEEVYDTQEEQADEAKEEEVSETKEEADETKEEAEDTKEGEEEETQEGAEGEGESVEGEVESTEEQQGEDVGAQDSEQEGTHEEKGDTKEEQDETTEDQQDDTGEDTKSETTEDDKSEATADDKSDATDDEKSEAAEDDKSEAAEDDKSETTEDKTPEEQDGGSTETETAGDADERSAEKDDSTPDDAQQQESEEDKAAETPQGESAESAGEAEESVAGDEESAEGEAQSIEGDGGSEGEKSDEDQESAPEEELSLDVEIPSELRDRSHVEHLLKVDEEASETEKIINKVAEITLRELKKLYENAIKPLEVLYKYRDLSNRHFGDSEIFSKPLILFMGPWSGGKSSIINYLLDNEYNETSLRTGAEPSPAYFNILMHGDEPEIWDGTQLAADFTFSGLQKFGQGLEERLRGVKLPSKLLEKVNIVEIPGILEVRKQVSRVFPFNDACQWFIDRADIIFLVYDPSKLDVGPETEAILDQLKGREHQTRIILNKADQVKPEELMRVQGALIWNISPLMSSAQPPVMYTTSLWSRPYESWAPTRLLQAQERAFLRDLRSAVDKRIDNKIASARRFAVRVRNHAKMVDCYLTTYYNHKSVFGNRKQVADEIIEHPQDYHIYEGLSTLTNISRYDLPDPDVYKDFFKLNPLYDFQQLSATCTYFRGCPINRLDVAIAYDLPELVGKHKRLVESALAEANQTPVPGS